MFDLNCDKIEADEKKCDQERERERQRRELKQYFHNKSTLRRFLTIIIPSAYYYYSIHTSMRARART